MTKRIPLCTASLEKPLRQATKLDRLIVPDDIKFEMLLEVPDDLYSLIAAIYVNVKAVAQLAELINRLRRDVDAAESVLRGELIDLVQSYEKNSRGQVAAKELALAALDPFLAVSANSISKAETSMFDFKGKLDGVDIKVSEMGIKLNKVISDQAELQREIKLKLAKQIAQAGYRSKKLPKLEAAVDQLGTQIQALIDDIPKALKKVEDARTRYRDSYKPTLAALKAKKPGWVDNAQLALKLGDLALGAGFTTFSAADSVLVLVDSIGVEATDVLAEKVL